MLDTKKNFNKSLAKAKNGSPLDRSSADSD